jgi:hypothetical protein
MMLLRPCAFALASGCTSLSLLTPCAFAQETPPPRPAYKFFRQDEDWSKFVAPASGGDFSDPLKHIALDSEGKYWLSFGGRAEARFEAWDGFGFGATTPGDSDTFLLSRYLLHGDAHLGEHVRVFIEGMSAQSTDRDLPGGRRTADMDTLDFHLGFVDLMTTLGDGEKLRLRTGRQNFSFGNQRLVSALPWANTMNRWEGFTALYGSGPWAVHALLTWFVPIDKTEGNDRDDDRALYGLYATRAPVSGGIGLDLYWFGDTRPDVTINGTTGDEERHTLGTRGWGAFAERGDWEIETAYQLGEVGDEDVSAWMFTGVLGWKFPDAHWTPRVFAGVDLASGDGDSGGKVETFHQLYPLGHAHLGFADQLGRQNVASLNVGAGWTVSTATSFTVTAHTFRLMEKDDALYGVTGAAARVGPFDSAHVGEEVDFLVKHKFDRHLDFYAGYSHFFSGAAISDSGTDDDIDFAYLGVAFLF